MANTSDPVPSPVVFFIFLCLVCAVAFAAIPFVVSPEEQQAMSASAEIKAQLLVGETNEGSANLFEESSTKSEDLYAPSTDDDLFGDFTKEVHSTDDLFGDEQQEEQKTHFVTFFSIHTGLPILYSEFVGNELANEWGYLTWEDPYERKFKIKNVPGITHVISERPLSIEDGVVIPKNPVE